MTIQEAIKINLSQLPNAMPNNPPHRLDALKLGIEALKFTLAVRGTILNYATLPLPGETEE
ncbi:hypothetical protein ES703_91069 [subsurface metagenome]